MKAIAYSEPNTLLLSPRRDVGAQRVLPGTGSPPRREVRDDVVVEHVQSDHAPGMVRTEQTALAYDGYEEPPYTGPVCEEPSTVQVGATAETIAVEFLIGRGYRIVERNFRCKTGELDIVARDAVGTLCFIEVRSRADYTFGNAAETVNWAKQRKVTRAAAAYLYLRRPSFETARFDVVAITGGDIDLIVDAWRLGSRR